MLGSTPEEAKAKRRTLEEDLLKQPGRRLRSSVARFEAVKKGEFARDSDASSARSGRVLIALACALACLLLTATSALARGYEGQLTEANGVPFTTPFALAVDGSNNLWVSDTGNGGLISKFSSTGTFVPPQQDGGGKFGCGGSFVRSLDLNDTSGTLYVADSCNVIVDSYDSGGAFLTEWSGFGGGFVFLAVDNSGGATDGRVYVAQSSGEVVNSLDATGSPDDFSALASNQITGTPAHAFLSLKGIATDANGNFYVLDAGNKEVDEFEASGEFVRAFTEAEGEPFGEVTAVAVDPTNEHVLLADAGKGRIDEFEASGAFLEALGGSETAAGSFGALNGLAVNSSGKLFVSDGTNAVVDVFGPAVPLPKVTYLPVTGLSQTEATLNAEADPNGAGEIEACEFQYGETTAYGESETCSPGTPYAGLTPVSAALSGLNPGTTYHYRLLLTDANGTKKGSDQTFQTTGPPSVGASSVSGISGVAATIEAGVNPSGFDTKVKVLYGVTEGYGSESAEVDIGSSDQAQTATIELTGLNASTEYHYRVVATNSEGEDESAADASFETEPALRLEGQSASGISQFCATLEAQVNPDGSDTEVFFEYGTDESYGSQTTPVDIGAANTTQPAGTEVCGLSAATEYHFHAVAENLQGIREGEDRTFTTIPALTIDSTSVAGVTATEATLEAQINPQGLATTYHFEYVTEAQFDQPGPEGGFAKATSTPETSLAADSEDHEVSATITGLVPETAYVFRVVTANPAAPAGIDSPAKAFLTRSAAPASSECPNEAGRLGPSALLPDCRAFEAVSPVATEGAAQVFVPEAGSNYLTSIGQHGIYTGRPLEVAPDGAAVVYTGDAPPSGGTGFARAGVGSTSLARRRATGGWSSQDIQPPNVLGAAYEAFSSDLSLGILQSNVTLGSGGAEGYNDLYTHSTAAGAGSFTPLFVRAPANRPAKAGAAEEFNLLYAGANGGAAGEPAGSHLLFEANDLLLAGTGTLESELQAGVEANIAAGGEGADRRILYDSTGGSLDVVNIRPDGQAGANATFGSFPKREEGQPGFSHAISSDGSRIFWSDGTTDDLYVRENEGAPTAKTVQVDGAEAGCGSCAGGGGRFLTASSDGSQAFFTDENKLTSDSTAAPGEPDLYEFDVESGRTSDLTVDANAGEHADVQGIVGSSEDGKYLYLVAKGALANNAGGNGEHAEAGMENLYLRHGGATTFIARLAEGDEGEVVPFDLEGELEGHDSGDWAAAPGFHTAEVSADGRSLVFMSERSLTGYDNDQTAFNPVAGEEVTTALEEVFLYEAEAGALRCVSCDPSGAAPVASEFNGYRPTRGTPIGGFFPIAKSTAVPTNSFRTQPRIISDSGDRVFFDSGEPLVPQDKNGWLSVYEWERDGSGSCHQGAGCTYLLSSGTDPENSYLIGASSTGGDAMFVTRARLVTNDRNENMDIYDARVDGVSPPAEAPPCEGEACRQAGGSPPATQSPGTTTFSGPGNPKTVKCKKGQVKRHGKCVKQKAKKHKKHHKEHGKKKSHKRANSNRGGQK
jgi:hypothetical protein